MLKVLDSCGLIDKGLIAAERALSVAPTNGYFIIAKAIKLNRLKRFQDALSCVEAAVDNPEFQFMALNVKAEALNMLEKHEEAFIVSDHMLTKLKEKMGLVF